MSKSKTRHRYTGAETHAALMQVLDRLLSLGYFTAAYHHVANLPAGFAPSRRLQRDVRRALVDWHATI